MNLLEIGIAFFLFSLLLLGSLTTCFYAERATQAAFYRTQALTEIETFFNLLPFEEIEKSSVAELQKWVQAFPKRLPHGQASLHFSSFAWTLQLAWQEKILQKWYLAINENGEINWCTPSAGNESC